MFNESAMVAYMKDCILCDGSVTSLYLSPAKEVVGVGVNFDVENNFLGFGFGKKNSIPKFYYIDDPQLDIFSSSDPILKKYLEKIRGASIKENSCENWTGDQVIIGSKH